MQNPIAHRVFALLKKINQPPWIILMANILSYGIMIPWLGLYSDDWVFLSTYQKMGAEGLARYFSTGRPIWGWIYQLTMPLMGKTPWHWHLFGLFWHWTTALSFWWLIRLIWPKQNKLALWAGLLFAVYPGFALQPISLTVGHMLIVYTAFILSACFLILAQQQPEKFWLFTALSMLMAFINLFCMEYFLLLHLLQPVMLFIYFQQKNNSPRLNLTRVVKAWWIYFALFIGAIFWRTAIFKYQTHNYQYLFLDRLKLGTGPALMHLVKTMLMDWWNTTVIVWVNAFRFIFTIHGNKIDLVYLGISLATVLILFLSILWLNKQNEDDRGGTHDALQMLVLGCLALIIAGGPFWLTEIQVGLSDFASRFTLPFIFGATMIFSSLLGIIRLPRQVSAAFLSVVLGLSIGLQFQINNDFRHEWIVQKNLFWQLAWRIPALEPGSIVFLTETPRNWHLTYATMTAIFDWNFQPKTSPQILDYAIYYPREFAMREKIDLKPNQVVRVDHIGKVFNGNTSQNITVQFIKDTTLISGCAHVMDPIIDANNPFLTTEEKTVTRLSNLGLITAGNVLDSTLLIPELFGKEPEPDLCYYFEKADLANQMGEWQLAIDLYHQSLAKFKPNWMATELVPFIGSFAHLGDWQQALTLTQTMTSKAFYPLSPVICTLWEKLEAETPDNPQKAQTLQTVHAQYNCQN